MSCTVEYSIHRVRFFWIFEMFEILIRTKTLTHSIEFNTEWPNRDENITVFLKSNRANDHWYVCCDTFHFKWHSCQSNYRFTCVKIHFQLHTFHAHLISSHQKWFDINVSRWTGKQLSHSEMRSMVDIFNR